MQSHDNLNGLGTTSKYKQKKLLLEMESIAGEDAMKTVEKTTKDLEYYIRAVAGFEGLKGLAPILKAVLFWIKYYKTVLLATEKSFEKGRINW